MAFSPWLQYSLSPRLFSLRARYPWPLCNYRLPHVNVLFFLRFLLLYSFSDSHTTLVSVARMSPTPRAKMIWLENRFTKNFRKSAWFLLHISSSARSLDTATFDYYCQDGHWVLTAGSRSLSRRLFGSRSAVSFSSRRWPDCTSDRPLLVDRTDAVTTLTSSRDPATSLLLFSTVHHLLISLFSSSPTVNEIPTNLSTLFHDSIFPAIERQSEGESREEAKAKLADLVLDVIWQIDQEVDSGAIELRQAGGVSDQKKLQDSIAAGRKRIATFLKSLIVCLVHACLSRASARCLYTQLTLVLCICRMGAIFRKKQPWNASK